MTPIFFKPCGCGGYPACERCRGTGRVRDHEGDKLYADYLHDRDKDDRLERKNTYQEE